ncbi:MAG TPA: GNAT family N-acetyltransferase [bacterium]|nr:GNAT family N-acetyltransferase [bacterium]
MGLIEREFILKVVPAKFHHRNAMVEINKAAAPKWHQLRHLNAALKEKRAFIAFVGRIPAGFLIWTKDFYSHYFIDLVVVHPKMRRYGVASAMIRAMEAFSAGNKLFSSTNKSNVAMQSVFERNGFVKSGFISHLDRNNPELIYYKMSPARPGNGSASKRKPRKRVGKSGKRKRARR